MEGHPHESGMVLTDMRRDRQLQQRLPHTAGEKTNRTSKADPNLSFPRTKLTFWNSQSLLLFREPTESSFQGLRHHFFAAWS